MSEITRRNSLKQAAAAAGLTTLAAIGAAPLAAQDDPPKASLEKTKDVWRAWAVTQGKETRLVVEGIYENGGPGLVAMVTPAVPQGINPKILMLKLKTATLPGVWPAVLTPIPAHYVQASYTAGHYNSIDISYPDGTAIHIKTIHDAGAGPS